MINRSHQVNHLPPISNKMQKFTINLLLSIGILLLTTPIILFIFSDALIGLWATPNDLVPQGAMVWWGVTFTSSLVVCIPAGIWLLFKGTLMRDRAKATHQANH